MSMPQQATDLVAYVRAVLFAEDTDASQQLLETGDAVLEGVEPEDYRNALEQVMEEEGVPVEQQEQVYDHLEAQDDYSVEGLKGHLQFIINDQDLTNTVDQSLDSHGTVHGNISQHNESDVANATGEGALAGEWVEGNQTQTGDGQQVGGDSGVQNQGNNSGQQAGWDATADNVTTGDYNTIGSDHASGIGQGQVLQDNVDNYGSSQNFGSGSSTNSANEDYTSETHINETATATNSFNEYDNDTNTQTQTVHGEEGGYEQPHYEPPHYEDHDDHGHGHGYGDDDDVELDQDIVEID